MVHLEQKITNSKWEIPFQVALHLIVFLFYSVDSNGHHEQIPLIHQYEIAFFLNYATAAFLINYVLFPRFLYQKKYWAFLWSFALLIVAVILMEELVLERIYFPDFRGKYFGKAIFTLIDVLPVTIILCGFKLAWDIIRKQMQVEELKMTVQESELKFLKSQINPHFLFNNLNNLYAHALENSPKTPEIILEMSSVLRYMLYECSKKYVSLNNELQQLENFIRLYEMQIEGRGKVTFEKINTEKSGQLIAPLILMVFVENAFKHSAVNQTEGIEIKIRTEIKGDQLLFTCQNTTEANQNAAPETGGIGLENVRKRLEFLYPGAHLLHIAEEAGLYRVDLKINLSVIQ